jgi:hypothetical protein
VPPAIQSPYSSNVGEIGFSEAALAQQDDLRLPAMANIHYAKIGDVWKHLPLAEVLSIERPGRYWEATSGKMASCAWSARAGWACSREGVK